ncbi:MAG: hypothetical protein J6R37_05055 [Clostridia bacterium]|nr:hypothetical protein [Clostridia bacterium]
MNNNFIFFQEEFDLDEIERKLNSWSYGDKIDDSSVERADSLFRQYGI